MSKIICDLCGTSYPETADQCPICGTARSDSSKRRSGEGDTADHYSYVKGGRFSHANVRRRTGGQFEAPRSQAPAKAPKAAPVHEPEEKPRSNMGLIIVVVILLLAIISICAYIAIRIIDMSNNGGGQNASSSQSSGASQGQQDVACTGISLSQVELEFTASNMTLLLQPILQPANTTEPVYYSSTNENVVTVDSDGLVTPVADGEAMIIVSCGGYKAECKVVCSMGVEPEPNPSDPSDPSGPDQPQPSDPVIDVELKLNRADFTLKGYGATWNVARGDGYSGPDPKDVTWSVEDETIATVENGLVTAVGNGKTVIYAEYGDQKVSCIVRCNGVEVPEEETCYLTKTDATIEVGEEFILSLLSREDDAKIQGITFVVENPEICSVNDKGRVTGLSAGMTNITVEYEGVTYKCIIRVKEAKEEG